MITRLSEHKVKHAHTVSCLITVRLLFQLLPHLHHELR